MCTLHVHPAPAVTPPPPGTCAQRFPPPLCRAPTAAGAGPTRSAPSVSKRPGFWKPSPLSRRPPMAGVPTGVTRLWRASRSGEQPPGANAPVHPPGWGRGSRAGGQPPGAGAARCPPAVAGHSGRVNNPPGRMPRFTLRAGAGVPGRVDNPLGAGAARRPPAGAGAPGRRHLPGPSGEDHRGLNPLRRRPRSTLRPGPGTPAGVGNLLLLGGEGDRGLHPHVPGTEGTPARTPGAEGGDPPSGRGRAPYSTPATHHSVEKVRVSVQAGRSGPEGRCGPTPGSGRVARSGERPPGRRIPVHPPAVTRVSGRVGNPH